MKQSYTIEISRFSNNRERKTYKEFNFREEIRKYLEKYLKSHGYTLMDIIYVDGIGIATADMNTFFDPIYWQESNGEMGYTRLNINDIF